MKQIFADIYRSAQITPNVDDRFVVDRRIPSHVLGPYEPRAAEACARQLNDYIARARCAPAFVVVNCLGVEVGCAVCGDSRDLDPETWACPGCGAV